MKFVFGLLILSMVVGCSSRPEKEVRIDRWHELSGHTIEQFREMQPDRPIVVSFYNDWCLTGHVVKRSLHQPEIFDLLTEFRVLPLIVNCTDWSSFEAGELQKLVPDLSSWPYLLVMKPSGKMVWIGGSELELDFSTENIRGELRSALTGLGIWRSAGNGFVEIHKEGWEKISQ